jgi:hypothetical protein
VSIGDDLNAFFEAFSDDVEVPTGSLALFL